jgi:hypothetical protein
MLGADQSFGEGETWPAKHGLTDEEEDEPYAQPNTVPNCRHRQPNCRQSPVGTSKMVNGLMASGPRTRDERREAKPTSSHGRHPNPPREATGFITAYGGIRSLIDGVSRSFPGWPRWREAKSTRATTCSVCVPKDMRRYGTRPPYSTAGEMSVACADGAQTIVSNWLGSRDFLPFGVLQYYCPRPEQSTARVGCCVVGVWQGHRVMKTRGRQA